MKDKSSTDKRSSNKSNDNGIRRTVKQGMPVIFRFGGVMQVGDDPKFTTHAAVITAWVIGEDGNEYQLTHEVNGQQVGWMFGSIPISVEKAPENVEDRLRKSGLTILPGTGKIVS